MNLGAAAIIDRLPLSENASTFSFFSLLLSSALDEISGFWSPVPSSTRTQLRSYALNGNILLESSFLMSYLSSKNNLPRTFRKRHAVDDLYSEIEMVGRRKK